LHSSSLCLTMHVRYLMFLLLRTFPFFCTNEYMIFIEGFHL
jgi:hypothetical protein